MINTGALLGTEHQRAAYHKLHDFINQVFAWNFFGTRWYFSNKSYKIKLRNLKKYTRH